MKAAAKSIHALGPHNVLIKGGHLAGDCIDLLFDGKNFTTFASPRFDTKNTHGTGCTFSAALATFLGQGYQMQEAVQKAKEFITKAITHGLALGSGIGPVNPWAFQ